MPYSSNDLKSFLAALSAVVDQRDALLTQVANLSQQNIAAAADQASAQAQIAALNQQVAALNAQVVDLTAQLAQYQPPVPKRTYVVGASIADPVLGVLPIQRTYSSGTKMADPPADKPTIYSCKVLDQAALTSFVTRALKGQVIALYHEPEDNIEGHNLTIATWLKMQRALFQTIKDCGRVGEVIPAVIFMGWSVENRKDMLAQMFVPDVVADLKALNGFIGWDRYSGSKTGAAPTVTPEQMLAGPAAFAEALGLDWAITETGTFQDATSKDVEHAAWWQSVFDYLDSLTNPPRYFVGWNNASSNFAIQKLPAVVAVWRAAMDKHGAA